MPLEDDNGGNKWAVSPALRQLLEKQDNLRHAEGILVNRKVHTICDLRDMNAQDQEAMCKDVEELFTKFFRWNTTGVPAAIKDLFQEARSPQKAGRVRPNSEAVRYHPPGAIGDRVHSANRVQALSVPIADTARIFPQFTAQKNAAAAAGRTDAASVLLVGTHSTEVVIVLSKDLDAARDLLGAERFKDVLRNLEFGEEYAAKCAACTAQALALADEVPLPAEDESIPEEQRPRKLLKNAKLALRNALLWRCIGWAQGLDSQEALEKRFPAFKDAAQTRAQLINGFSKIRDSTAKLLTGLERAVPLGGTKPKRPKAKGNSAQGEPAAGDAAEEVEPPRARPVDVGNPMKVVVEGMMTGPLSGLSAPPGLQSSFHEADASEIVFIVGSASSAASSAMSPAVMQAYL